MPKSFHIKLLSMEHNSGTESWSMSFEISAPYISRSSISVSVEDHDQKPDRSPLMRSPEDILARARRRIAIGLGVLAELAHDAVDETFKEAVKAEVLRQLSEQREAGEGDDRETTE